MDRKGWIVTASSGNSWDISNAIDGKLESRWSTGDGQKPGNYFQIDFGESLSFDRIEMAVGPFGDDYPKGYAVYATNDTAILGSPIASGAGAAITRIDVPVQNARYVRIVSTDSDWRYWSIGEINVSGWKSKIRTLINAPDGGSIFDVKQIQVDFGSGANKFTMRAASAGSGGEVELRLDSDPGTVIGRCFFHHTGSPLYSLDYECESYKLVAGYQTVNMKFQDYTDPEGGKLLKVSEFKYDFVQDPSPILSNRLNIYPPVPGLEPSPYYEIRVSKVSELDSADLTKVTNWKTPFAFFTECPVAGEPAESLKGYFTGFIDGWSHTYTNFEMDANTPIVVKISRKASNTLGAPAGAIKLATAHPVQKVESIKIINGDVYVTMNKPAQIAIDIDGQMDGRDAPRDSPTGWGFPFRGRDKASHTVSIFANPVIENKPQVGDAGVLVIEPGKAMPDLIGTASSWTTAYFLPGVHNFSVDNNEGNTVERNWRVEDRVPIIPGKKYYVPGDAIVYGTFSDVNVPKQTNNKDIQITGHGTISGSKIQHNTVFGENDPLRNDRNSIAIKEVENTTIEGVTVLDSANHNISLTGSYSLSTTGAVKKNTIKFVKVIAWRSNSDAASVGGNIVMEDSFFRVQDDGHYIGGAAPLRRITFWHDTNGQDFRGDFATGIIQKGSSPLAEKQLLIEDIDIIYARSVFAEGLDAGNGEVGFHGDDYTGSMMDNDVLNTGQMIFFRNIRVSDPKPNRSWLDVDTKIRKFAGVRFENITYAAKEAFGWRNQLRGGTVGVSKFVFDSFTIAGEKVDINYMNNPVNFKKENAFDMTFRFRDVINSTPYTLINTATNGSIKVLQNGTSMVTVTAAAIAGYQFSGWGGDLSGVEPTATITMDKDKAITAYFKPQ